MEERGGTTHEMDVGDRSVAGAVLMPSKTQASLGEYSKDEPATVTVVPPAAEPRAGWTDATLGSVKVVKVEKAGRRVDAKSLPELKETAIW